MSPRPRRTPSPALVVAVLALVGAWGGPAVAQSLIGSREVRDGSLTHKDIRSRSLVGGDVRSNTLTGRVVGNLTGRDLRADSVDGSDIDESTLGEVPRARHAQRADLAASADRAAVAASVEGSTVRRLHSPQEAGTGSRVVFELDDLQIEMRCSSTSVIGVTATTKGDPAWIRLTGTQRASNNSVTPVFSKDDDLRSGDEFDVLAGGGDNLAGTLTFVAADHDVVTVDFMSEGGIPAGRGAACLLAGTAIRATG